ncbi:hypothetical protein RUM44_007323 [Polyplax serrata]|uniref:Uncharacterized protein n=1 Tax=Polyplax serrata TaxID=468196 RepID=A0ABR1B144_POLSC
MGKTPWMKPRRFHPKKGKMKLFVSQFLLVPVLLSLVDEDDGDDDDEEEEEQEEGMRL